MILTKRCRIRKHGFGITAEVLRGGEKTVLRYRNGMTIDEAQAWHWKLHGYKPLTKGQEA